MAIMQASAFDDLVFCSSLFLCFSLARTYKGMEACDKRREFGAGLGLFVSWFLCGTGVYHAILIAWGNVVLIKAADKSYVHLLSLSYTWLHLIYLYNNFVITPYAMWVYQTIALRMVGLAYELALFKRLGNKKTEKAQKHVLELIEQSTKKESQETVMSKTEETTREGTYELEKSPLAIDIIAYAFFFIGIHKGPYYSWKVFYKNLYESSKVDYVITSANCTSYNQQKAFISGFIYILLQSAFPTKLYYEEEFYKNYGGGIRFLYGAPQLILYFLRCYTITLLCSSVFTEAGFTLHSCDSLNLPRKKKSVGDDTVTKCLENQMLLFNPLMSDTVRIYDMPTGCWFSAYPYLYTIKATKEVRSAFSFFLWTVWRGASATEVLLAVSTWVYVHLEIIYSDILEFKSNADNSIWNTCLWVMRLLYMVYITPCLVVYDSEMIFNFYSSILWTYHCVLVALTFSAAMIRSQKLENYLLV